MLTYEKEILERVMKFKMSRVWHQYFSEETSSITLEEEERGRGVAAQRKARLVLARRRYPSTTILEFELIN